jgi:dTDP-4-amino-4,6-dideoxygalactose transaminase
MIQFNQAPVTGDEAAFVQQSIESGQLCGDGPFTKKCQNLLQDLSSSKGVLLTPSCTAALEMAALLIDIQPGDEIIMPSYTFVSTANAFALRGARIVFVDVDADTMNMSVDCIQSAITPKTRAIVPVHYAGVACDMDGIMNLAQEHNFYVVEDAAQAIGSFYNTKALGSIGHMGTLSFHETKNLTSGGEGGALLINDESLLERAEIIREKGTNRHQFFRGQVAKYSWVDIGSSYLPSELQAAYLYSQLQNLEHINNTRRRHWNRYYQLLEPLTSHGHLTLPYIPRYATHNAHMFYMKVHDLDIRTRLLNYLKENHIAATFHYVPLHSAKAGKEFGRFNGSDNITSKHSDRLLRLPMHYHLKDSDINLVCKTIYKFFGVAIKT